VPVYILREGQSNIFKIGRTKGSATDVVKRLQTGNSQPLTVFETVTTTKESACEAFFHRRLVSRRVGGGGGWEFFQMESEEHMRLTIQEFEVMARAFEEARKQVSKFDNELCNDNIIEACPEDRELLACLLRIKEEQEYLKFERALIESKLKLRIGTAYGIRGVASWDAERRFNGELFKESDPGFYLQVLARYPCIDTAAWKAASPEEYETLRPTYFSVVRKFLSQKAN
jgi:hypothetical protein